MAIDHGRLGTLTATVLASVRYDGSATMRPAAVFLLMSLGISAAIL